MITLLDHDNKQVKEETVDDWIKSAVCEYFRIGRDVLYDVSRAHISSYPRKLYWYFGFLRYGLSSSKLAVLNNHDFGGSSLVIIQANTIMLQKHYNKELAYDIAEISKILDKFETLAKDESTSYV